MNSGYIRIETLTILQYIYLIITKKEKANNQTSITKLLNASLK